MLLTASSTPALAVPPGTQVQGNVFGKWETCVAVGPPERFGGQTLRCPSLNSVSVFSATDVRPLEQVQGAPDQPAVAPQPIAQAEAQPRAQAQPRGRQVEGRIFGNWEICTLVGKPERYGGQTLHCPSLPDDNIFSATDVREIGQPDPFDHPPAAAAPLAPAEAPAQAQAPQAQAPQVEAPAQPRGRQVQGNVFGTWETCTLIGKQQGAGGYILHCPSLPDDNIFSESDVRL